MSILNMQDQTPYASTGYVHSCYVAHILLILLEYVDQSTNFSHPYEIKLTEGELP